MGLSPMALVQTAYSQRYLELDSYQHDEDLSGFHFQGPVDFERLAIIAKSHCRVYQAWWCLHDARRQC